MGGTVIGQDKNVLRKAVGDRRARSHAERARAAGEDLAGRCMDLFGRASEGAFVAAYWPMRTEIDVRPLMARLKEVAGGLALPIVQGPGEPLAFRLWKPGNILRRGPLGTSQPAESAPLVEPRIVVAPLLAFDMRGNRLGYGGGYYDRTLRALRGSGPVKAVGVAYDEQEVPCVPAEPQDEKLDAVVTDRRTILFPTG